MDLFTIICVFVLFKPFGCTLTMNQFGYVTWKQKSLIVQKLANVDYFSDVLCVASTDWRDLMALKPTLMHHKCKRSEIWNRLEIVKCGIHL